MNERELLKLKREIEQTDKEVQREKGRLSSFYDDLTELLDLPKMSNKKIETKAKKKIKELTDLIKSEQERLDDLLDKIEQETDQWND